MASVEHDRGDRARGAVAKQCKGCGRFARLLPGDEECAGCTGALALEFGTIAIPSDTRARGGW